MGLLPSVICWACYGLTVRCLSFFRIRGLVACSVTIFFFLQILLQKFCLDFFFGLKVEKIIFFLF